MSLEFLSEQILIFQFFFGKGKIYEKCDFEGGNKRLSVVVVVVVVVA